MVGVHAGRQPALLTVDIARSTTYKVYEPTNTSHLSSLMSQHTTFQTHVQQAVFSRARERRRHSEAGARIGTRGGVRVAFGTVPTAVKRSFNGAWERPGQGLGWPPGAPPYESLPPGLEPGNTLRLARLLRCECDLDSRTQKKIVRATVKVAMDEEQTREQERVFGRYSVERARSARGCAAKTFLPDPLAVVSV